MTKRDDNAVEYLNFSSCHSHGITEYHDALKVSGFDLDKDTSNILDENFFGGGVELDRQIDNETFAAQRQAKAFSLAEYVVDCYERANALKNNRLSTPSQPVADSFKRDGNLLKHK